MNKLVYSEEQLQKFHNILPLLKDDEVYFVSMNCRNKYTKHRNFKSSTQMLAKDVVKDNNFYSYLRTIYRFETNPKAYLGFDNKPIPNEAMVVYVNINPSSTLKTMKAFRNEMDGMLFDGIKSNFADNTLIHLKKLKTKLLTCFQKEPSRTNFIDVDFDIPKKHNYLVEEFINQLKRFNVNDVYVIETRGGYHVLITKEQIKFNINDHIDDINTDAGMVIDDGVKWEIVRNKNNFVPLPGTLQGGFEVKFVDI